MDRSKKMTETESEIMEVLWSSEAPMSAAELVDYAQRKEYVIF